MYRNINVAEVVELEATKQPPSGWDESAPNAPPDRGSAASGGVGRGGGGVQAE